MSTQITAQPFNGNVSAQASAGETVTLQVTRPDASLATLMSVVTDASANFVGTFTDTVADQTGTYTAVFNIAADATFASATVTKTYTIGAGTGGQARALTATIGNSG